MIATKNLIKVEVKNPKNDPNAARIAVFVSDLLSNSPISAPTKGPIIIPPGMGENNPIKRPIIVPIMPDLEPPNFFVPMAGIK